MSTFASHAAEAMERREGEGLERSVSLLEERAEERRRIVTALAGELQLDPLGAPRRTIWNRAVKRCIAVVRAA